ncbi:MAG: dihydrolipoyl dehydrogenase [Gammaproteobacteria bacterium]|nr:dihydrolipoyl dehydrogenase [Pseudomonadota bacterium]MCH9662752.1 dihydrolipoyl dehydrogenase [Gammaproteobacteria bacterium]
MSKSKFDFDVIVIGAGPAGYVCAIRCAQLGLRVACVDDWLGKDGKPALGGTCLNVGCIPSKAMLDISQRYADAAKLHKGIGLTGKVGFNLAKVQAHKEKIVATLNDGVAGLFRHNGVETVTGRGQITGHNTVSVSSGKKKPRDLTATNIVIATGSTPIELEAIKYDEGRIVDSQAALELASTPGTLGVIGAGVIGLELGSVWRRFGAEVVMLEAMSEFLPICEQQISAMALKIFSSQGLDIRLGARVASAKKVGARTELTYQDASGTHTQNFDKIIVAVGREPNSGDVFTASVDIVTTERGFIQVNEKCLTSVPGIYAVGDVTGGLMLAHKGSEEGVMVAETIAGMSAHVNYDLIPSVVYTHPEISWVGATTRQLDRAGIEYNVGKFPFAASGRALASTDAEGMTMIVAGKEDDRVLGAHIIGPHSSELIASIVVACEFGASAEDIARTNFAHPTLSEAVHEAALAVDNRALHIANRPRS